MSGEVVGVYSLEGKELLHGFMHLVLLIERDAELTARIARLRELGDHFLEVGNFQVVVTVAALDLGVVVERTWIVWTDFQGHLDGGAGGAEFFPADVSQTDVGEAVCVVWAELDYFTKGVNGFGVLELIEVGDADVVPAHPVGVVVGVGSSGCRVFADGELAGFGSQGDDGISGVILAEDVIDIALAQVAIVDAGGEGDGAFGVFGDFKLVADQRRAASLDAVVVGDGVNSPYFVVIDKHAAVVDGAVGEAVGAFVKRAVGLNVAALVQDFAVGAGGDKAHPCFVEVANLGDEGVADVFVLQNDVGLDGFTGVEVERLGAERGDEFAVQSFADGKDIDVEIIAGTKEVNRLFELFAEAVVEGDGGVAGRPAMGDQGTIFGAGLRERGGCALHVAALAGGVVGLVEGERIALRELGILPFVIGGEGANFFVLIQRLGQVGFVTCGAELGLLQEGLHDGFGVTVQVGEDLGVGRNTRKTIAFIVDEHSGDAHGVAAVTEWRLNLLDGVAGHAGKAILVELTINDCVLGEASGEDGDGVVAAVTVAGEFNTLGVDEDVDAGPIEGCAKAVAMEGLLPLVIGLLVTVAAVVGGRECVGAEEGIALNGGVAGRG